MCGRGCQIRDRDNCMLEHDGSLGTWHNMVDSEKLLSYNSGSMPVKERKQFEGEITQAKQAFNAHFDAILRRKK